MGVVRWDTGSLDYRSHERNLATSSELLRPSSSVLDVRERARPDCSLDLDRA